MQPQVETLRVTRSSSLIVVACANARFLRAESASLFAWPKAPRWVQTVFPRPVQADDIARGVGDSRLSPQPGFISRFLREQQPRSLKLLDPFIERLDLKVDNRLRRVPKLGHEMHRKRREALRTLETSVVRRTHDQLQAQAAVKVDRGGEAQSGNSDLVEVHKEECCRDSARWPPWNTLDDSPQSTISIEENYDPLNQRVRPRQLPQLRSSDPEFAQAAWRLGELADGKGTT